MQSISLGGEGGIRTLDAGLPHTPLAGERFQPLSHLSYYFSRLKASCKDFTASWARSSLTTTEIFISEVEIASDNESGLDIVEQKSISAHVKKAIELLPLKQRKVIELSFVNDLTQEEIAGELNIPIGTVKSRMRLAYQKMKDNLKELQAWNNIQIYQH